MPGETHFGRGRWELLGGWLDRRDARRILLVCGDSVAATPTGAAICDMLGARREVIRFGGFQPNTRLEDVLEGIDVLRRETPHALVALGGGTAMDLAKAIRALGSQRGDPVGALESGRYAPDANAPLLAVLPTTAGTGSQATTFATVYVDNVKHSLDHPSLMPDMAIVDEELAMSAPGRLAASAGFDALCHAVESYWSVHSTERSRRWAAAALRLILNNIVSAATRGDFAAMSAMTMAAHLAGKAINITRTTGPHALSYTLTSRFGVAHGHACALTLPEFFTLNAAVTDRDTNDPRGAGFVRARLAELLDLFGVSSPANGRAFLIGLLARVGLETKLPDLGISHDDAERQIVATFDPTRAANNPRAVDASLVRAVFQNLAHRV